MKNAIITFVLLFFAGVSWSGPVSVYGALNACKTSDGKGRLCGSGSYANTPVQIRGVSFGWSNTGWESAAFFNEATVNAMIDGWMAEIIRAPYGQFNDVNKTRVKTVIDAAIVKDVYVIIDFHSHNAHNQTSTAKTFFTEMAQEYGDKDHVIFEIYNEPNCKNGEEQCQAADRTTWTEIKPYADEIIEEIRKYSSNLIVVGTPQWCQLVDAGVSNPITKSNIAYVLHFYAQSHLLGNTQSATSFQSRINNVLNAGYPVFASEYGTTDAGGGQKPNNYNTHSEANANAWHTYMDENQISNVAWNINDKYEGSAFFGTNSGTTSSANRFQQTAENFVNESMMTESGKYIFNKLKNYASSAPWRQVSPVLSINHKHGNNLFFANSTLNLELAENSNLDVFDLRGNKVFSANLTGGTHKVSLNNLSKGVYFAVAKSASWKQTLRIVR
jgi:endoglucanase